MLFSYMTQIKNDCKFQQCPVKKVSKIKTDGKGLYLILSPNSSFPDHPTALSLTRDLPA